MHEFPAADRSKSIAHRVRSYKARGSPVNCGSRLTLDATDAMRLYLQNLPGSAEPPRYVQIVLEQDLLGGWTLYRETGQQGGKATLRREQFLERDAAIAAFEKARDTQLKRGYRLMFAQGLEGPYGR